MDIENRKHRYPTIDELNFWKTEDRMIKISLMKYSLSDIKTNVWSFEEFGLAIHSSGVGIWGFDMASSELTISYRCQEILQLNHSSSNINSIKNLILSQYAEKVLAAFKNSLKTGDCFDIEFPVNLKNESTEKWLKLTGTRCSHAGKVPKKLCGTIVDITALKKSEVLRKDLLSMVTHDLRSPLSAIKLLVQMGKRMGTIIGNEPIINAMVKADCMIEKMNRMIQCLLEVSLIEYGKINILPVVFNMTDLLIEEIDNLRFLIKSHRFILRAAPCHMTYADRDKISQVFQNMLSNAVKYSPNANEIIVECKEINSVLNVSVIDQGIGISKVDQGKIFERFYRVESEHSKVIEGYGIGLYLSKQIILAHDGDIGVKSNQNQGCTFFFSLPVSPLH